LLILYDPRIPADVLHDPRILLILYDPRIPADCSSRSADDRGLITIRGSPLISYDPRIPADVLHDPRIPLISHDSWIRLIFYDP
jgi:hypothetical protein